MFVHKWKVLATMVVSVALMGTGTFLPGSGSLADPPKAAAGEPPPKNAEPEKKPTTEIDRAQAELDQADAELQRLEENITRQMVEARLRLARCEDRLLATEHDLLILRQLQFPLLQELRRGIDAYERNSEPDSRNAQLKRLRDEEENLKKKEAGAGKRYSRRPNLSFKPKKSFDIWSGFSHFGASACRPGSRLWRVAFEPCRACRRKVRPIWAGSYGKWNRS